MELAEEVRLRQGPAAAEEVPVWEYGEVCVKFLTMFGCEQDGWDFDRGQQHKNKKPA